jgi:hypothetical protein
MNATSIISALDGISSSNSKMRTLTKEEIMQLAPMAYATSPTNPDLSKHYVFASTEKVIDDMKKLGWDVVEANQPRRRKKSSFGSYHMIIFQNSDPSYKISHKNADGNDDFYYPQVILTNSHDGFSSFCFRIAIYHPNTDMRYIIATSSFNSLYLRHMGYSFEELQDLINKVMEEVPNQVVVMNNMQNRILTQNEKYALALAALRNRQNDPEFTVPNFILDEILEPKEKDNEPYNLWKTFAIITSKMIEGCFMIPGRNGKLRKARRITGISKYIHHSQILFAEAVKMI